MNYMNDDIIDHKFKSMGSVAKVSLPLMFMDNPISVAWFRFVNGHDINYKTVSYNFKYDEFDV